jgi:hypothetical protein
VPVPTSLTPQYYISTITIDGYPGWNVVDDADALATWSSVWTDVGWGTDVLYVHKPSIPYNYLHINLMLNSNDLLEDWPTFTLYAAGSQVGTSSSNEKNGQYYYRVSYVPYEYTLLELQQDTFGRLLLGATVVLTIS